jgi:protein HIRA/HIR1
MTKDGKKRVAPTFLGTSANTPIANSMPQSNVLPAQATASESNRVLDLSAPSATLPRGGMPSMVVGNKRKHEESGEENGDIQGSRQVNGISQDSQGVPLPLRPAIVNPASTVAQVRLGVPRVMSHFEYSLDEKPGYMIETKNGGGQANPSRVTLSKGKTVVWVDYIPRAVLLMTGNDVAYAAGCEDGTIIIWNKSGRRLLPPIVLESQPCFLESQGQFMLCITSVGMLHVW